MRIRRLVTLIIAGIMGATGLTASSAQADSLLFGQTQFYTATMRADKRVVTHAKIVFTNSDNKEKTAASFSMPDGIKASNVTVYQIIPPLKDCQNYETLQQWKQRNPGYDSTTDTTTQREYSTTKKCLDQPNPQNYNLNYNFKSYASNYSYSVLEGSDNKISFEKLTPKQDGNKYTVPLSLPTQPKKEGALLIAYLADGFISEFAGSYTYNYQTLKVDEAVDAVTVAVNLDEDLYSKGTKARTGGAEIASDTAVSSGASAASGKSLIDLQNSIGRGGTITRTSNHLLPGDTFSVGGSFADSPWKLYYGEIFVSLVILAAGIVIGWFFWRRNRNKPTKPDTDDTPPSSHKPETTKFTKTTVITAEPPFNPVRALLAALLGIAGVVVSTLLFNAVTSTTSRETYYGYTSLLPSGSVILLLIYGYFLIVLPVFLTIRHGYKTVFTWATLQVVLLIITVMVATAVTSTTTNGSSPVFY